MSLSSSSFLEEIIMTAGMQTIRCSIVTFVVTFIVATLVAVTAAYGPVALELAGLDGGTVAHACSHQSGTGEC